MLKQEKNNFSHIGNIQFVDYEPAVLKEWPTGWQIEYRIFNPNTLSLEKKRIRFEKIRKRLGNDVNIVFS